MFSYELVINYKYVYLIEIYYPRSVLSGAHVYQDSNFKNFDQQLG
jgi:hypothetical protein